jgi:hypothetical protein
VINTAGYRKMNQGLKRFKMHRTPVPVLEQHPLAVSSYQTAKKFGPKKTNTAQLSSPKNPSVI